jgi:predicted signal transduction protein with EAL and GGDEF domain
VTSAGLPTPRWVVAAQALASACLVAALVVGVGRNRWNLPLLGILVAVAIASDMLGVESESLLKISGASLAIVLAAVLLGGAPAALVGAATILVGWLRWREDGHYLRNNLLAFAAFPFIVGTAFQTSVTALRLSAHRPELYALVVLAYMSAVALNFWIVVGYQCLIDGRSVLAETQRMFKLLVTSELVCAVLTAGIAWLAITVGVVALALVAIALVSYQHVVGRLLVSRERAQQLRVQAITDALTGLPNRTEFIEQTQRVLVGAQARSAPAGVMLMDLDDFKQVNDALGHHMGDLLLTGSPPAFAASSAAPAWSPA